MNATITKAVIAAATTFGTLVQASAPATTNQWLQVVAESLAAGVLVWYVPNQPKSPKSGGVSQ